MDENGEGESWEPQPRVRARSMRCGLPVDQRTVLGENPAAESFSSPSRRFNPLGAASSLGQTQTLDGGSFPGFYGAAEEVDRDDYTDRSIDAAFERMCSLQPSADEFPTDDCGLFYKFPVPYGYGLDGSQYLPMPIADQPYTLDGGFLINSSPLSRREGESLSRNLSTTTFSNSNRSSPDCRSVVNGAPAAQLGLSPELFLESLRGNIVPMAMHQQGSRTLQTLIDGMSSEYEVEFVLNELLTRIGDVMVDGSGNYVVQKLIERCSDDQIAEIVLVLNKQAQFCRVCQDPNGVRVMQRLLERVDPGNSFLVFVVTKCLAPYVVKLGSHPNGQHVILHCVRHFPQIYNQEILITLARNCEEMAKDKSGCCVLQQCVEHSQDKIKDILLIEIIRNAVSLSTDCYGNYVVQHILGLMIPNVTAFLLRMLKGNFQALSKSKYGSNVVEKCLKECNEQQADNIITELLESPRVSSLFVDPYGNYVVQSALEFSKGQTRKALIDAIVWNSPSMRSNLYGKKILGWLEKRKLIYK